MVASQFVDHYFSKILKLRLKKPFGARSEAFFVAKKKRRALKPAAEIFFEPENYSLTTEILWRMWLPLTASSTIAMA